MDSDQRIEGARKPPGVAVPLDGGDPMLEDLAYLPDYASRHDLVDGRSQWPAGWYVVQEVGPDDGNGRVELRGCAGSCWRASQLAGWTFARLRLEGDGNWHRAADWKYTMFPGESSVVEACARDLTTEWIMWCRHNIRVAFRPASVTTGRDVYSDQTREEILSVFSLMRDGRCEAYHLAPMRVDRRPHVASEYGWSDGHHAAQMLADRDNLIDALRGIIAGAAETVRRHAREVEEARAEVAELRDALHVDVEPEPYLTCFFCGEGGGDVTLTSRGGVRPDPASSQGRVTQAAHRACILVAERLRSRGAELDRLDEVRADTNEALATIAATLMDDRLGEEWLDRCEGQAVAASVRSLVDLAISWRPVKRKFQLVLVDRRTLDPNLGAFAAVRAFEAEPGRNVYLLLARNVDPVLRNGTSPIEDLKRRGVQIVLASVPTGVEVEAYELVPAESLDVVAQRPAPDPRRCPHCGVAPQPGFRYCRGLARFLMMPDADEHPQRCG
jgi:hypothetical protein